MQLTDFSDVQNLLPANGSSASLEENLINPGTLHNHLAGEVVALKLNVVFDNFDENFCSSSIHLGELIVSSGVFTGFSVNQVLLEAEKKLGGCDSEYSNQELRNAVKAINKNYENAIEDDGYLICPTFSSQIQQSNGLDSIQSYFNQNVNFRNYPQPFSKNTRIQFTLNESTPLKIVVYDFVGKQIDLIFDSNVDAGKTYVLEFDGTNLPNGTYFYKAFATDKIHTGKMILIKD